MLRKFLAGAVLLAASAGLSFGQDFDYGRIHKPKLTAQTSGTTQLLIAVSPVDSRVVWASGAGGTWVKTTDGGDTWTTGVVPGAEALQFRDVQGVNDKVAYLMSIGDNTTDFKIWKTVDGGTNWTVEFTNETANAFYDCMAFWTPWRGIAHSDSVNGVFPDLRTFDGRNWESIENNEPPALTGEASFAASGTCVATEGVANAWIATGGSTVGRILATRDGGNSWNAYDTPLLSSPSAGNISVAFRDSENGMVGGGDLSDNTSLATAVSHDGGKNWNLTNTPPVTGSVFCLAYAKGMNHGLDQIWWDLEDGDFGWDRDWSGHEYDRTVVVTAESAPDFTAGAAAWTPDEGRHWYALPEASGYWGLGFANPRAGWFVGNNGQILKISF